MLWLADVFGQTMISLITGNFHITPGEQKSTGQALGHQSVAIYTYGHHIMNDNLYTGVDRDLRKLVLQCLAYSKQALDICAPLPAYLGRLVVCCLASRLDPYNTP